MTRLPFHRSCFNSLLGLALLSSCRQDDPDPYATLTAHDWVYVYSTHAQYDDDAAHTLLWQGKLPLHPGVSRNPMRFSAATVANYQHFSLRYPDPIPYTRREDLLTLTTYSSVAPSDVRILHLTADSLILQRRIGLASTVVGYILKENHFARH